MGPVHSVFGPSWGLGNPNVPSPSNDLSNVLAELLLLHEGRPADQSPVNEQGFVPRHELPYPRFVGKVGAEHNVGGGAARFYPGQIVQRRVTDDVPVGAEDDAWGVILAQFCLQGRRGFLDEPTHERQASVVLDVLNGIGKWHAHATQNVHKSDHVRMRKKCAQVPFFHVPKERHAVSVP